MRRKISSLLLTVFMIMQLGTAVFAGEYFDSVDTSGKIQITQSGSEITESTSNSAVVSKSSNEAFPKFDYLCTLNMQAVRDKFTEYYTDWAEIIDFAGAEQSWVEELERKMNAMKVTGKFEIEIAYPACVKVPSEFFESGKMTGFDDNVKLVFGGDVRTLTEGETENHLKIEVELLGKEEGGTRPGFVTVGELKNNLETYLCDFTLKCDGVETTEYGDFTVSGKMSGVTFANGRSVSVKVDYKTVPETISAVCSVIKKSSGGGSASETYCSITFDVDGDTNAVTPVRKIKDSTLRVSELKVPHKDGCSFDGWYFDKDFGEKVSEDFKVTENITLYGTMKKSETAEKLNAEEHFAYVIGYPDGTVRPEDTITREETAVIFYRLLTDEERAEIFGTSNGFSDIEADRWSNTEISSMQNGGFIKGYADGTFAPDANITRAEFAAIASRLDKTSENLSHGFTDIDGHWAENYIADAVAKGWIAGYEDGTFRPEQNITRAEAMTIINRMLNRFVNAEGISSDAVIWPDNGRNEWYYYAVEEATNSHEFVRQPDGIYEKWTAIKPNKDWTKPAK